MKAEATRFEEAISQFPQAPDVLARLDEAQVPYIVGGSLALYTQGNPRMPHDLDIMFTDEAHEAANKVFGLEMEFVERPTLSLRKSTPVTDGSVDFLSHFTVIADGASYRHPPREKVAVEFEGRQVYVVPAEKILVFKLMTRRDHHDDMTDADRLIARPDFEWPLFWQVADAMGTRAVLESLLKARQ